MKRIEKWLLLMVLMLCSIVLFAACELMGGKDKTYTVTFMTEETVYKTIEVEEGKTVVFPTEPFKSGYTFEYWVDESGEEFLEDTVITKDITLTASWTKFLSTYRVAYFDNNNKQIAQEYVKEGDSPKNIPTVTDYETDYFSYAFEKWVTTLDGDEEADFGAIIADTTYYAKFTKTPKLSIEETLDFVINVESGRDVRILQLTDTQIIDPGQCRYPTRFGGNTTPITDEELEDTCFKYIRQAIEVANPDLIIMTGDIVYGEFDDTGEILTKMVAFMESFNIPWAPVFGNHDNESTKGVTWQCKQFEEAENCLFKRGELTGNGNYNIGIMQGGKLVKVVYMMDSNGCGNAYTYSYDASFGRYNEGEKVKTTAGFGNDQKQWLKESAQLIDLISGYSPSKFVAFHIPIAEFAYAAYQSGYQSDASLGNDDEFHLGKDTQANEGDSGIKGELFKGCHVEDGLWEILQSNHFDGVFVGHSHLNNVSMLYEGIRLTFGTKSSTHDRTEQVGGTLITVAEGGTSFSVEPLYYSDK